MNEEKAQRFVIKLMDMTSQGDIKWEILGDDPHAKPDRLPFKARLVGYAYEASWDSGFGATPFSLVLFRCRLPIIEDCMEPIGWDDYLTYILAIYDENDIFRDEISQTVVLADLYEEVQDQIHPVDSIIDQILAEN